MALEIANEQQLDDVLSTPNAGLIETMRRLDGDLMILGVNGKMGLTMARLAKNAIAGAGGKARVFGVSRFGNPEGREQLEAHGVETIACDFTDRAAVAKLPQVPNVIFMAGRKFGTGGAEDLTWAMNTVAPWHIGEHFRASRIVAFSTGCVYPLADAASGGCDEEVPPAPIGEYAQSCLGRERIFQYCSRSFGTRVLLFRLNYSVDLRYGVLHDIAQQIWNGSEVVVSAPHFNVVWQGDANAAALRALELADNPPAVLNVTGPETASIRYAAEKLGAAMGKEVRYAAESGNSGKCYLANAAKFFRLYGYPSVALDELISLQASWIANGGRSLGKPTHFEVNNGKF